MFRAEHKVTRDMWTFERTYDVRFLGRGVRDWILLSDVYDFGFFNLYLHVGIFERTCRDFDSLSVCFSDHTHRISEIHESGIIHITQGVE